MYYGITIKHGCHLYSFAIKVIANSFEEAKDFFVKEYKWHPKGKYTETKKQNLWRNISCDCCSFCGCYYSTIKKLSKNKYESYFDDMMAKGFEKHFEFDLTKSIPNNLNFESEFWTL